MPNDENEKRDIYLRLVEPLNEKVDLQTTNRFLPEVRKICSNRIRAGIIHLLINSPDTLHSMQVENISFRMGVRPRIVIYHLEKLKDWRLVEVKKNQKYGNKERRSIWGLNLKHPNWVSECYNTILSHFFDDDELVNITNQNKTFRKNSSINKLGLSNHISSNG